MLTVVDVLAVPVVRSAAPVLLTPASTGLRLVRWVHTSEIYEIGPLLQGQELLLTTGLGLVGQSPERLRRYVDSLADKGVAGVCLELGRTFDHVPPALVERASERDIAVVAFHAVVPFVAMTEAVHELLLDSEVASLRAGERLTDSLLRAMSDGVGLDGLLAEIASVVGAPVRLTDTAGGMVAESAG
ncbi:MAG: PucR family transcriptional regulator ligand-binding domain-containing protein, partial [Candidatus Lutibacillus vidarii]